MKAIFKVYTSCGLKCSVSSPSLYFLKRLSVSRRSGLRYVDAYAKLAVLRRRADAPPSDGPP